MNLVNNGVQYKIEVSPIKVKDLIEYLQKLDPETEVLLDKEYHATPLETIEKLFDVWSDSGHKYLTIDI